MFTTRHQISIIAPIDKVWQAITDSKSIEKYTKGMKVETDWQEGSKIVYTMYNEDGEVVEWEGMIMIRSGVIETLEPHEKIKFVYEPGSGIQSEVYKLSALDRDISMLILDQVLDSKEVADKYVEGNEYTIKSIKDFVEAKTLNLNS